MNISTCTIILIVLIALSLYFYLTNHKFRYYAKYSIYISVCSTASILLMPVALFRPKSVSNLLILAKMCQISSPLIGIEWTIEGTEYLSNGGPFIIMANHQSVLDILGMFHVWPILKRGTAVAKKELLYMLHFGVCLWLCGLFFIPRSKSKESRKILNDALQSIKKEKINLWIFPEGTRRSDGQIHEFKKGGFHMALSSQIPILPVVISRYDFIDHDEKQFEKGKMTIKILPPISTEGRSLAEMDEVIEETRTKMIEVFHSVNSKKTGWLL